VLNAFNRWKKANIPIFIYSSGSIEAQKLIFGYAEEGDLNTYISGNFDTTIGSKLESPSYEKIFKELQKHFGNGNPLEISQVTFVTDNILEAEAASKVGMDCVLSDRPGNKPLPSSPSFPVITTFDRL
jgi:2,3-diketo-5-methylthio-1-phosphopentane phosphatase